MRICVGGNARCDAGSDDDQASPQPSPGWAPDPGWAGGWACTSHPGVLGSIPKREEPGKTGAPCVKVPGSSRVPAPPWVGSRSPDGWDQIPRWAGGWVLHQPPWSFGFDSQTRGTRENRRTLCSSTGFLTGPNTLLSFSPPSFHTISLSLAFTSV